MAILECLVERAAPPRVRLRPAPRSEAALQQINGGAEGTEGRGNGGITTEEAEQTEKTIFFSANSAASVVNSSVPSEPSAHGGGRRRRAGAIARGRFRRLSIGRRSSDASSSASRPNDRECSSSAFLSNSSSKTPSPSAGSPPTIAAIAKRRFNRLMEGQRERRAEGPEESPQRKQSKQRKQYFFPLTPRPLW
jgi:hypothetical protein